MINKINEVIEEIKNLQGREVLVFGQKTIVDTSGLCIDITEVLENLKDYAKDLIVEEYNEQEDEYTEEKLNSIDEYLDYLEEIGDINPNNCKSDNSYNWNSNINHNFYIHTYENLSSDTLLVVLAVHKYGDIRGNYTEEMLFEFNCDGEFYEAMTQEIFQQEVEIEGKNYYATCDIFEESLRIEDENYDIIGSSNATDLEELIQDIKELIEE